MRVFHTRFSENSYRYFYLTINNAQKRWNSTIPMTSDFLDERKMVKKFVDKTDLTEGVMRKSFSKKLFFIILRKFGK